MSSPCKECGSERCNPAVFHLCPACNGEGCADCTGSIIPGIVPGEVEEGGNIFVCSDYGDGEIEAAIYGTRDCLIEAMKSARDCAIEDRESAQC